MNKFNMNNIFSVKNEDISKEDLQVKKVVSAVDNAYKGTSAFAEMDTIAAGQALHGRLSLSNLEVTMVADRLGYSEKEKTPEGKTRYIRNPLRNCKPGFAFLAELNAMSEEERAALRMKWEAEETNRRLNSLKLYKLYKGEKPKAPTKLELIKLAFEESIDTSTGTLQERTFLFQVRVAEIIDHEYTKVIDEKLDQMDNAEPKNPTKKTTKKTAKK